MPDYRERYPTAAPGELLAVVQTDWWMRIPAIRLMLGEDPPPELAQTMHAAWVAFASTGNPGWPRYERGRRATMRFDTVSRVVEDPRAWERALWTGIR